MKPWTRRDLVKTAGAGLVCGALPPFAPRPKRNWNDMIDGLADRIIATPRDRALELAIGAVEKGLGWRDVQAAVFLAGLKEIQPRPVGFKLHAVFVVESVFQLCEATGYDPGASYRDQDDERWLAVLWNLDDCKRSHDRDRSEGDWKLGPAPEVSFASKEAAARELTAAMEAWDAQRADRAVVGALALLERAELFEILWPFALRDFSNLGHKPIFASHVERTLARIGDEHAQPALRALVYGLLDGAPGPNIEEFEGSRRVAAELPVDWTSGQRAPARSLALARALRSASPEESRERVAALIGEGADSRSVWDGVRLAAADLFARAPGLLPVHPTTVTSALAYIQRTAREESTRKLALLQAASWLPLYRGALRSPMQSGGIDPLIKLAEPREVTPAELFADPSPLAARACLAQPAAIRAFDPLVRAHLLRGAREHHELKYAAVLLEDLRFADPSWHPVLLASALEYLPSQKTSTTRLHERSREIVQRIREGG